MLWFAFYQLKSLIVVATTSLSNPSLPIQPTDSSQSTNLKPPYKTTNDRNTDLPQIALPFAIIAVVNHRQQISTRPWKISSKSTSHKSSSANSVCRMQTQIETANGNCNRTKIENASGAITPVLLSSSERHFSPLVRRNWHKLGFSFPLVILLLDDISRVSEESKAYTVLPRRFRGCCMQTLVFDTCVRRWHTSLKCQYCYTLTRWVI